MKWQEILNRRLNRRGLEFKATKPSQVNSNNMRRVVEDIYTAINTVKETSSANVLREDFQAVGGNQGQLRVIKGRRVPDKDVNGNTVTYNSGDVVSYKNQTYIASKKISGKYPILEERAGWVSLSKSQVFYQTTTAPFFAKEGDE